MAASLLADIDWTSLSSAELTTAVKALCQALQERHNIGAIELDGDYPSLSGPTYPSATVMSNMFPYKNNTPTYTLSSGDPLIDFTRDGLPKDEDLNYLLERAAALYADIERWNDAATNKDSGDTRFNLAQTDTDDPSYPTRLHEITGYTTYPDLSMMAPEEVKKLYDMVLALRYVIRQTNTGGAPSAGVSYIIFTGEFDPDQDNFFVKDDPTGEGANYYNAGSALNVDDTDLGPYNDFLTGNGNLFGSGSASYDQSTDSASFPPPWRAGSNDSNYNIIVRKDDPKYICYIKAAQTTHGIDYADMKASTGIIGKPIEWKSQTILTDVVENFPAGHDTNFQYPGSTTAENQRYWETISTVISTDLVKIHRDNLLQGVTLPSAPTDLNDGEEIELRVQEFSQLRVFILEDWDGDGGFEYYTPP